jgi:hypothetical protein
MARDEPGNISSFLRLKPTATPPVISQLPQAAIFVLRASGLAPEYTEKLLDAVMAEYIAAKKEMSSEKSDTTQSAIIDEMARIEREIRSDEDALLEFQKQNNVYHYYKYPHYYTPMLPPS